MRHWFAGLLVLGLVVVSASAASAGGKKYSYYRVGNPNDVGPSGALQGGTVLMGGGTDVDAAFPWMCDRAASGDFLVIRATGTDAYNPYIQSLCPGMNSVATLIIPTLDAANDPFVTTTMRNAEAIWIAGGDQSNYVMWKKTAVQAQLNAAITRKVPVGGTSAGMMVLTQFIYAALTSQGVTSSQALADPYNKYITLDRDLVAIEPLAGTIGDSHFVTRDRMGRTLAFMARLAADGWTAGPPRAIAVDEATALLIPDGGAATVVGASAAYFLEAPGAAEVCAPKTPLTYRGVGVYRLRANEGGSFDFGRWVGRGGTSYTVTAEAGALSSNPPGIY